MLHIGNDRSVATEIVKAQGSASADREIQVGKHFLYCHVRMPALLYNVSTINAIGVE